ncbi:MAG TPA: hypothetical protein DIC34_10090 [Treponema sp.]|nr:MAG: hypothetical protein A2001_15470 [Treponema sp. GWC1_61_84]OHE76797.1 MAG: hypothetical protein A2413_15825 [Treponema sp. RIFOXYC1_FULL_61_9]HCM26876.1 hypothetical protein [Treponema sp.]
MDFDRRIDRIGSGALKWDSLEKNAGLPDIVPLWVADMDFPSPPEVVEALRNRAGHPVYGYTMAGPGFFEALVGWYSDRYGVAIDSRDVLAGPGLVPSLGIAVRAFSEPADGVLVMSPVYYPFYNIVRDNGRRVIDLPLVMDEGGRYVFSAAGFDKALKDAEHQGIRVPMMLFCSPHNPGGTVWSDEELGVLLAAARKHGLLVVSDEIHGDFVHRPRAFASLAALPEGKDRIVVLSSANKTFNLAGLHLSHFIARDGGLRARLKRGLEAAGYSQPNVFSLVAAEAAYRHGGPWLDELLAYLRANIDFAVRFINDTVPGIRARAPEGTYLIWADASELIAKAGLEDDRELAARLEKEGRVKVTAGGIFGSGGRGFIRINVACPRAQLGEGLARLAGWAERHPGRSV